VRGYRDKVCGGTEPAPEALTRSELDELMEQYPDAPAASPAPAPPVG
jgi:hypothetical protein